MFGSSNRSGFSLAADQEQTIREKASSRRSGARFRGFGLRVKRVAPICFRRTNHARVTKLSALIGCTASDPTDHGKGAGKGDEMNEATARDNASRHDNHDDDGDRSEWRKRSSVTSQRVAGVAPCAQQVKSSLQMLSQLTMNGNFDTSKMSRRRERGDKV